VAGVSDWSRWSTRPRWSSASCAICAYPPRFPPLDIDRGAATSSLTRRRQRL